MCFSPRIFQWRHKRKYGGLECPLIGMGKKDLRDEASEGWLREIQYSPPVDNRVSHSTQDLQNVLQCQHGWLAASKRDHCLSSQPTCSQLTSLDWKNHRKRLGKQTRWTFLFIVHYHINLSRAWYVRSGKPDNLIYYKQKSYRYRTEGHEHSPSLEWL